MILRHRAGTEALAHLEPDGAAGPSGLVALRHGLASPTRPWWIRRGLLWSAALDGPRTHRPSARIPVRFRQVDRRDLPELLVAAADMDPISPDALRRRCNLGRQCNAAWDNGSIAAYGWLTRGREWVGEFERELNSERP